NNPEIHIQINRDKMSELGLTMQQVEDALNSAYAARQISTMYTDTNQNWVIIEVAPFYYRGPNAIGDLYLRSPNGGLVHHDTIANITVETGLVIVNHQGQFPSVTLSFNLQPGESLGSVVNQVDEVARNVVPPSVSTSFQGTAAAFQESFQHLWLLLIIAV